MDLNESNAGVEGAEMEESGGIESSYRQIEKKSKCSEKGSDRGRVRLGFLGQVVLASFMPSTFRLGR